MFSILIFAFRFNFPPFLVLIIALLNDGSIMSISTDRVVPSKSPDKWEFRQLFTTATILGLYLSLSTLIFFHVIFDTAFVEDRFSLAQPWHIAADPNDNRLHSIIYLQVSISGQLMIFSTRSHWFWFSSRPGILPIVAFCFAQTVSTLIAVYADWGFAEIQGIGWGWAGVVWVWSLLWFIPMDVPKIASRIMWTDKLWRIRLANTWVGMHPRPRRSQPVGAGSVQGSVHRASIDGVSASASRRLSIADTINKVAKID